MVVRRALLFVMLALAAVAALAFAAPYIGLGRDEAFIGFVLFDWTRSEVAMWAALVSAGAFFLLGLGRAIALGRWIGSRQGQEWIALQPAALRWALETGYPACAVTLVTLAVFLACGEAYFRATIPFTTTRWPSRFDPSLGFIMEPGAQVRWTNGVDFWIRSRANSLGLLDRERPGLERPGVCRVLLVGDSFVEAAQVDIQDKVHIVFESIANGMPLKRPIETAAVGYSGTGQGSQLPLFEKLGRSFRPDVVVLVFVSNDFWNNSAVLEALSNGWHPRHPPRAFFSRDPASAGFRRIAIDPDWRNYAAPEPQDANQWSTRLDRALLEFSYFYGFLRGHWLAWFPPLPGPGKLQHRIDWLKSLPGYANALDGWAHGPQPDPNAVFFQPDPLPQVFEDALGSTRAAIEAFVQLGREDGFRLLVLGSHSLRDPDGGTAPSRQVERLRAILDPLGIPYVDQTDYIRSIGRRPEEANFQRDGHWNQRGHRWAAEALMRNFASDPAFCDGRR